MGSETLLVKATVLTYAFRATLELPPSTNKLYQRRRGGGLALTSTAKRYQESVKTAIKDLLPSLTYFPVDCEVVYLFDLSLYFDRLENNGWFERFSKGKNKGERKAQTRYKILDYDNRVKFLQDCLVRSIGIPNDCQIFESHQRKCECPAHPRAEITISVVDRAKYFPTPR